jgi:O-acetyl-ADP-ribose deacetylase (regulator of RNase III)
MSASVNYIKGDAANPQGKSIKIICHVCNDLGGWGKGFVLAISKRWEEPEAEYRSWHREGQNGGFVLGAVRFVKVEDHIWVANMIGQRGMKRGSSGPPIRYEAVAECLAKVAEKAKELNASVHMPRIGCGLAGGEWSKIEPLIDLHLISKGIAATVYDFG